MRHTLYISSILGIFLISFFAALAIGSVHIPLSDVFKLLWAHIRGIDIPASLTTADTILWELRLPRIMLAFLTGGGLALVGVAMQALIRNPLADPYVLGISGGASVGAAFASLGIWTPLAHFTLLLPLSAFAGGLLVTILVFFWARMNHILSTSRLLLAGVAVASFTGALTSFLIYASGDPGQLRTLLFWLMGSFSRAQWSYVAWTSMLILPGSLSLWILARPLDALLLGEESAWHLGIPVESLKRYLLFLAALITGTLVAFSGVIGFVGLIVPHMVRLIKGVSHRYLIPWSFLTGGLLLIWTDLASRTLLAGQELPVGILTALLGVPFFLILLRKTGTETF